jgi:hypothetical protein
VRLLTDRHQQLACSDDEAAERASYEICLAAWGAWLVEWRLAHETDADVSARREDVFFQLIHALCASCPCPQLCDEEIAPHACQPGFVFCVRHFYTIRTRYLPPSQSSPSKTLFFFWTERGRCSRRCVPRTGGSPKFQPPSCVMPQLQHRSLTPPKSSPSWWVAFGPFFRERARK